MAVGLGEGVQALASEPFGQQWQEVRDGAVRGELVVAGVQEPFDGLGAEVAVELLPQTAGCGLEGELPADAEGRRCSPDW
nr:hypothetical protein [Lentzea sp. NBRC 102530]